MQSFSKYVVGSKVVRAEGELARYMPDMAVAIDAFLATSADAEQGVYLHDLIKELLASGVVPQDMSDFGVSTRLWRMFAGGRREIEVSGWLYALHAPQQTRRYQKTKRVERRPGSLDNPDSFALAPNAIATRPEPVYSPAASYAQAQTGRPLSPAIQAGVGPAAPSTPGAPYHDPFETPQPEAAVPPELVSREQFRALETHVLNLQERFKTRILDCELQVSNIALRLQDIEKRFNIIPPYNLDRVREVMGIKPKTTEEHDAGER